MGQIAASNCDVVILTNEDPYDEDPQAIIDQMSENMNPKPTVIMDRREAIKHALSVAAEGDVVLISGKGTDPYIMEANGKRTPWDDATVVREELARLTPKNL
jgi:UDP-N-acetylmuramoyl-L-alanyl-D-glutamate--2,6-diaminopimelate ligase